MLSFTTITARLRVRIRNTTGTKTHRKYSINGINGIVFVSSTFYSLFHLLLLHFSFFPIARYFSSSILSYPDTRSLVSIRLVVMACIVMLADATLRKIACDRPSLITRHYNGYVGGYGIFGQKFRSFLNLIGVKS